MAIIVKIINFNFKESEVLGQSLRLLTTKITTLGHHTPFSAKSRLHSCFRRKPCYTLVKGVNITMYIKRNIESKLIEASKSYAVITIYGPRQCGKSTTLLNLFGSKIKFVSLDDEYERAFANQNPKEFLNVHGYPLVIDEIQKAKPLIGEIKKIVDNYKFQNLKTGKDNETIYYLTGSSQTELKETIAESLAGRTAIIDMLPLSLNEKHQKINYSFLIKRTDYEKISTSLIKKPNNKIEVFSEIFRGGYPEIYTKNLDRDLFFASYIKTYIERDVLKLINSSYESQFISLLYYLALRTATQVSYEVYAREIGIDVATVKRWLSILESSNIIKILEPFYNDPKKRIIKSSKLYFLDTGLCAYLCRLDSPELLSNSYLSGNFMETFVVSEIVKKLRSNLINERAHLFYYRDRDQKEIDIIYFENNTITPFEIKKNDLSPARNKNFKILQKYDYKINPGFIIYSGSELVTINEEITLLPLYYL